MEKRNVILNKLLVSCNAQEMIEDLNEIIYEYAYVMMAYSSKRGYVLTNEYDELYHIRLILESLKKSQNFDDALLNIGSEKHWTKTITNIVIHYSTGIFEVMEEYLPERAGIHIAILKDIINAFESAS